MSSLNDVLLDIQTLLATNASGVSVYRADYVPTELGDRRDTGFITWNFDLDRFEENSCEYTGNIFGNLDIVAYAVTRSVRDTLYGDVLDILLPVNGAGKRAQAAPFAMASSFMHYTHWTDTDELFVENQGHETSETPGIFFTFECKLST
jgi:hypothetical protein